MGTKVQRVFGLRTPAFTFEALVIGSVLYSMPFVVQPIRNAFEAFGDRPLEVAATLRASPWDAFWSVAISLARPGFSVWCHPLLRLLQELDLDVVQRIQVREPVAYRAIEQRIILQELAMIRHGEQGLDRVVMLPANAFEDRLS
jgi:hypothetical protein